MTLNNFDKNSFILGVVSTSMISLVTIMFIFKFNVPSKNNAPLSEYDLQHRANEVGEKTFDNSLSFEQQDGRYTGIIEAAPSSVNFLHWRSALTETLSEKESYTLSETPPYKAAKALSESNELLVNTLEKIQELTRSEQRAFLLRALQESTSDVRKQASEELLASARILDRKAGVSLLMSLDDTNDKVLLTQLILQTETEPDVLKYALAHMSSDDDKASVELSLHELKNIAELSIDPELKGLAVQIMMKIEPDNEYVLKQVSILVESTSKQDSYHGLNILNQQLNDYGITLTKEQIQTLKEQLIWIADDNSQGIDNRIKALLNLKLLAENYTP